MTDSSGLGSCQVADDACSLSSECPSSLVCRAGLCTNACEADRDCASGATCLEVDGVLGCITPSNIDCVYHSECPMDFVCGVDHRCREECHADKDCRDGLRCDRDSWPWVCALPFDAGPMDAGTMDAGSDAEPMDAGFDGGPMDAGFDAGPMDAGFDAGPMDAGGVPGTTVSALRLGSPGTDIGWGIATDASGNVLVTGSFSGTVDFGGGMVMTAGGEDIFVLSLRPDGTFRWARRFGGTGNDAGAAVSIDGSGNVRVTGSFTGTVDFGGGPITSMGGADIFVLGLDPGGAYAWASTFGSTGIDLSARIATDGTGNVLVTGAFSNMVDFGSGPLVSAGPFDVFVLSLRSNGSLGWARRFGGGSADFANDVATDTTGNVRVTGFFGGSVDFGGGPIASAGGNDVFVLALDSLGSYQWARGFGGTLPDLGMGIATDAMDNVRVTGELSGTVDFGGGPLTSAGGTDVFVLGLAPDGTFRWASRAGGTLDDRGNAIATDAGGNVVVTGYIQDTVDFGGGPLASGGTYDIFALDLASDGSYQWARVFGGTGADLGYGVTATPRGTVLVTGEIGGPVDFGLGPVPHAGGPDVFLLELE